MLGCDVKRRAYLAGASTVVGAVAGCVSFGTRTGRVTDERLDAPGTTETESTTAAPWVADPVELPVPESELFRAAPKDSIPAIVDPVFGSDWSSVSYEIEKRDGRVSVMEPRLVGSDEVLGVERDGVARAYPLKVLDWHEVVNDVFDGPRVVTYCPVCRSGVVADRRVAGAVRTFGVSGLLFRANLVLYDDSSESLWGQLVGQAIRGPLTGERLDVGASTVTTWWAWQETHPDTEVLLPPPISDTVLGDVRVNYDVDVYSRVRDIAERYPEYGPLGELDWGDTRLQRRAVVIGVVDGEDATAYPLSAVQSAGPINDTVGDRRVVVALGRDRTLYAYDRTVSETTLRFAEPTSEEDASGPLVAADGSRWRVDTGVAIDGPHEGRQLTSAAAGSQLYWAAWLHAHPGSSVYGFE